MVKIVVKERGDAIAHQCPGCGVVHMIRLKGPPPLWTWNGDVNAPTLTPSVHFFTRHDDERKPLPDGRTRTLCHYKLTSGKIEFLSDSLHRLRGRVVELPDMQG